MMSESLQQSEAHERFVNEYRYDPFERWASGETVWIPPNARPPYLQSGAIGAVAGAVLGYEMLPSWIGVSEIISAAIGAVVVGCIIAALASLMWRSGWGIARSALLLRNC